MASCSRVGLIPPSPGLASPAAQNKLSPFTATTGTPSPYANSFTSGATLWCSRSAVDLRHLSLSLRALAFILCFASSLSLAVPQPQAAAGGRHREFSVFHYPAFRYCISVTIIASIYLGLQLFKGIWDIAFRGFIVSEKVWDYVTFFLDQELGTKHRSVLGYGLRPHTLGGGADGSSIDAKDVAMSAGRGGARGPSCELQNVSSSWEKVARGTSLVWAGADALRRRRWRRQQLRRRGEVENRSWLLAEARAGAAADAQSAHSSFRLSFGSHMEAEEATESAGATPTATAVLLLVNLEEERERFGYGKAHAGKRRQWLGSEVLESSISSVSGDVVKFSYPQIWSATRDFSKGRELGRGGLGRVYRGRIGATRRLVAIKRVEGRDRESAKAFCRELLIVTSLRSPNVVPLLGYCVDQEGLFLVYKYVSGGSLDHHLYRQEVKKGRGKVLSLEVRYKVALGIALALEYLHFGTDKCIIHRDIKPSNIILSSNKTPKLCDFGLATWTNGSSVPFLCKSVKGTFGYLAPEYFQHGKLSDKTDVYAFGVVLLELITGQKAIDRDRPLGEENLVLWANPFMTQGIVAAEKLIDPRLKPESHHSSEMSRMIHAATACLNSEEARRPTINEVIGVLRGEESYTDWPMPAANGCLDGHGAQSRDTMATSEMGSHLALAMLGVSDEEDDLYNR